MFWLLVFSCSSAVFCFFLHFFRFLMRLGTNKTGKEFSSKMRTNVMREPDE